MTVYRVGVNDQKFQFFEADQGSNTDLFWQNVHGTDIGADWVAPSVYIFNPKKKEGAFVGYLGGRVFAIAQATIDAAPQLQSFFEQSGELLPFTHDGRDFYIFNCTNCLNALDRKKSVITPTGTVDKHAFLPTRFHFTLFSIPESKYLFCVEGMSAPHDEFKGYVEQQKLTGLMFEKLWSEADV